MIWNKEERRNEGSRRGGQWVTLVGLMDGQTFFLAERQERGQRELSWLRISEVPTYLPTYLRCLGTRT